MIYNYLIQILIITNIHNQIYYYNLLFTILISHFDYIKFFLSLYLPLLIYSYKF